MLESYRTSPEGQLVREAQQIVEAVQEANQGYQILKDYTKGTLQEHNLENTNQTVRMIYNEIRPPKDTWKNKHATRSRPTDLEQEVEEVRKLLVDEEYRKEETTKYLNSPEKSLQELRDEVRSRERTGGVQEE